MLAQAPDRLISLVIELVVAGCTLCCATLGFGLVSVVSTGILKATVVSWPYTTLIPEGPDYRMVVDGTITIPGVFGAVLDPYTATLSTMSADASGTFVKSGFPFAKANFPRMALKHGENKVDFSMTVTPLSGHLLKTQFIDPMFTRGQQVSLAVDAEDITMHVLGAIPIPNKKLHKVFICRAIKAGAGAEFLHNATSGLHSASQQVSLMSRRLDSLADPTRYAMSCIHSVSGAVYV